MYLKAKEKPLRSIGSLLAPVLPGISNLRAALMFGAREKQGHKRAPLNSCNAVRSLGGKVGKRQSCLTEGKAEGMNPKYKEMQHQFSAQQVNRLETGYCVDAAKSSKWNILH